ncbi:hypothetical protein A6A04_10420 [Paramagnetospirillum marisnigri]|uniref:Uncharacterized protein n=2 Tax=Paramagnetospirillum marisnigri TaxID=1285242 RepID=A0A178MX69_9PROT|nr:hypothetical protein A6A04_10420 [Paramagnetospirillum marisnigri]
MGLMLAFVGQASAHVHDGQAESPSRPFIDHPCHDGAEQSLLDRNAPSHDDKGRHCVFASSCCVAALPSGFHIQVLLPVKISHGAPGQQTIRQLASIGPPAKPPRL